MKTYATLAVLTTVLALEPAVQAQACYTPVTSFQGSYSLTANSGSCTNGNETQCSIDEAAGATVNLPLFSGCSPTAMTWETFGSGPGGDTNVSATINDEAQGTCGEQVWTATVGDATDAVSYSALVLNFSLGYGFSPVPATTATFIASGCMGNSTGTSPVDMDPEENFRNGPFTIPATVQPLKQSDLQFQSWTNAEFDGFFGQMTAVPWTFSFTLTPKTDCTDCKQWSYGLQPNPAGASPGTTTQGGPPVSSSVSTQSQSLGEDVPIVGTGFNLHYESKRAHGAGGDAIAAADSLMIGGWTLSVHHAYDLATNTLFLGDGRQRSGYELGTPVYSTIDTISQLLTSEDGSEVYVFSVAGQHLETVRPLTGALLYKFGYDSAGNLVTVTDATGNVTTIKRNTSEQPTAIVSPYGQTTNLTVDSNGFLSEVTDPLGKSQSFLNSSSGLLESRTDQNGNKFTYTYDNNGGLAKDADPLGGYTELTRTNATSGFGWTVGETTSMGRTSSYQSMLTLPWTQGSNATMSEQQTNTWPDGLQAISSKSLASGQLSESFSLPDGTSDSETLGPDPVWGLQVPVDTSETLTQGNLTMNITGSRVTMLGTAGNPFTVSSETDTQTINGRTYTSTFTGSSLTWVNTSPVGRTVTVGLDSLERIASTQIEGLTATNFAYDSRGRLVSATQGPRKTAFGYNTQSFLASVTDPLKQKTSFTYDTDGRLLTTTLPDGREIAYSYDANGNRTSVAPPGESAHDFAYNAVNLPETYSPPTVAGTGATTYAYDLDRDLTTITRPDGETIDYGYDDAGRLISATTPTGTTKYTYNSTTGNLASTTKGAEKIAYSYNGPLPTKSSWTGTVAGSVSRDYDANFWVSSQSVGGGSKVTFDYDSDGLLTKAGSLAVKRSSKNGLITGTTLGAATDSRSYNSFGELIGYTASTNGTATYSVEFTRDANGRVTAKTETIGGTTNTYSYAYDPAGRLISAKKDSATDSYTYDTNSNRLSGTTSSGTANGTYDAQDRLLTYGNASYTYTANGELASQKVGKQATTYKYDVLGNLIAATLPSGTKITYVIDGENHRVGKEVNGVLETGFLYDDDQIVAQLNGSNQLVNQFVYSTGAASPDYMVSGGVTYRIFSDQLGSPVLVINASTGTVAEQITYDEFGNVVGDTNPGFQPFGFAGGLYDQDTKLIRFGARDYNPSVGRWTAKDPILFDGGDTNLYGYVLDDPVNMRDAQGLQDGGSTGDDLGNLLAPLSPDPDDLLAPLVPKPKAPPVPKHKHKKKKPNPCSQKHSIQWQRIEKAFNEG